jgi:hypothetical protein
MGNINILWVSADRYTALKADTLAMELILSGRKELMLKEPKHSLKHCRKCMAPSSKIDAAKRSQPVTYSF